MANSPLVSVVMNCFNGEEFLDEALRSVFAQTYQNFEVIFWDNASTDNSAAIAKQYGPKIKYFRADANVPLGHARSLAVPKAQGELIAFLDTDDLWMPNRLEVAVKAMGDPKWGMCYAGMIEITRDGHPLRKDLPLHQSGYLLRGLLLQFDIVVSTWMIRSWTLRKHGFGFDPTFRASEEYNLALRIAAREPVATIPEYLGCWRGREDSTTSKTISYWATEREKTLNQVIGENPGILERHRGEFAEAFARGNYYRARHEMSQGNVGAARNAMKAAAPRGLKYFLLYAALFFPKVIWESLHNPWLKRKVATRLLQLPYVLFRRRRAQGLAQ